MKKQLTFILIIITFSCGEQIGQKTNTKKNTQVNSIEIEEGYFLKKKKQATRIEEKKPTTSKENNIIFSNGLSQDKLLVEAPSVILIKLDSVEIEQLKEISGEDIFYTASDDLMWYNSIMLQKMDSLNIPVNYSNKDTVKIQYKELTWMIIKDSTFSFYTYYYFDGNRINRTEIYELIEK